MEKDTPHSAMSTTALINVNIEYEKGLRNAIPIEMLASMKDKEMPTLLTSPTTLTFVNAKELEEFDESDDEKELTNLTWLTELRNQNIAFPNTMNSPLLDNEKPNQGEQILYDDNKAEWNVLNDNILIDDTNNVSPRTDVHNNENNNNNKLSKRYNAASMTGHQQSLTSVTTVAAVLQQHQQLQQQSQSKRPTPIERYEMFLDKVKRDLVEYHQTAINYQTNTTVKPPFNYSHIIGMAMLENGRVTLQQICSWIEAKFAFFRVRKKWNNSIRHNLSLHHCFRKIDRNKYEKGKGGYWELGMDPKKCDRKRIRNRKSYQSKNKQALSNGNNFKVGAAATSSNIKNKILRMEKDASTQDMNSSNVDHFESKLQEKTDLAGGIIEQSEELLLDDLDVHQNIDVTSCNVSNKQGQQQLRPLQQQNAFIPDILNASTADGTLIFSNNNNAQQQPVQQQYQLGTIIISTSANDIAAATTTFNCLINDNYNNSQQQNVLYTEDEIPPACENVIVSSFLANGTIDEFSFDANNSNQHKQIFASSNYSQRPNVFVEQLEQPTSIYHYASSSATSASITSITGTAVSTTPATAVGVTTTLVSTSSSTVSAANCDYTNIVTENFRPYIDGIDEAFQYLRSIDNNREDILDNLLDISVSDY